MSSSIAQIRNWSAGMQCRTGPSGVHAAFKVSRTDRVRTASDGPAATRSATVASECRVIWFHAVVIGATGDVQPHVTP